jgi:hypothetical protein
MIENWIETKEPVKKDQIHHLDRPLSDDNIAIIKCLIESRKGLVLRKMEQGKEYPVVAVEAQPWQIKNEGSQNHQGKKETVLET